MNVNVSKTRKNVNRFLDVVTIIIYAAINGRKGKGNLTISSAVEEYLLYLDAVKEYSLTTISSYRNDLTRFISLLPSGMDGESDVKAVATEDLKGAIGHLSRKGRSAATINRFLAAVRSFLHYCRKWGYVEVNAASGIKCVKDSKRIAQFLTVPEVDALCAEPLKKELLWANRDRAILEMLYSSGCRVSELAGIKISDMLSDASSAIVRGKGGKDRRVYFEKDAQEAFKTYMIDRENMFFEKGKADDVKEVFINQRCTPLTRRSIWWIVSRYSGAEGINHRISTHKMRHTFATAMVTNGADVRVVQEMLGHKSISTTQRYTHITTEHLLAVYNKAHPHS